MRVPAGGAGPRAAAARGALKALAVNTTKMAGPGGRHSARELPYQLSFSAREMGHARLQAPTLRGAR